MTGIVIVNYNTYKLTLKCVDSILNQDINTSYHIYIIDNCSSNNSYEEIKNYFGSSSKISVLEMKSNLGYARANNEGVRVAKQDGCNRILISNNDILFEEYSIDILENELVENDYFIVAPRILDTNKNITNSVSTENKSAKQYILDTLIFKNKHISINCNTVNTKMNVIQFSGSCFMVDINKFEKIGYFDQNTFLYFEEHIISEKAIENNYTIKYIPSSVVIHEHGATTGKTNWMVVTEMNKSELYYLYKYKNASKKLIALYYKLKSLKYFTKSLIYNEMNEYSHYSKELKKWYKVVCNNY